MIKIGLVKETKTPIDNRVPLTPEQCAEIMKANGDVRIVAEPSAIRAFSDDEFVKAGVELQEDLGDCDVLMGVKEVAVDSLLPGKHYVFFGHIAKLQEYNRPLCHAMIKKGITFTDWEYLTDGKGQRVIAFGHWAGIVGAYNALRLYGLRHGLYELPAPTLSSTEEGFVEDCRRILPKLGESDLNMMITGDGKVANGAIGFMKKAGAEVIRVKDASDIVRKGFSVYQLGPEVLVKAKNGDAFSLEQLIRHPSDFTSRFGEYSRLCDILVSCHFWNNAAPKYLTKDMLPETTIDTVADVTCDINGSIETTVRPSTHSNPFYGVNRETLAETDYRDLSSIGVMAVDTCPNALPRDSSEDFGRQIMRHLIPELLKRDGSDMVDRATIIAKGHLSDRYSYMGEFAKVD